MLEDQISRSDLIVTTGGTGTGPGDMVRRILGRDGSVRFTEVSLFPCTSIGYGTLSSGPTRGEEVPVICLPGDPGAALIGFEVLVRPVIQQLAGAEPVFRPSVRAHLLETRRLSGGDARVPPRVRLRAARRRLHRPAAVRAGRTRCPGWPRPTG